MSFMYNFPFDLSIDLCRLVWFGGNAPWLDSWQVLHKSKYWETDMTFIMGCAVAVGCLLWWISNELISFSYTLINDPVAWYTYLSSLLPHELLTLLVQSTDIAFRKSWMGKTSESNGCHISHTPSPFNVLLWIIWDVQYVDIMKGVFLAYFNLQAMFLTWHC